ncbi:hypothetical protein FRX31_002875 [Thalictrum thalictroides]|uniref:Uncharacterized protein n=1 Tax=Thalictrum thalictroides TaxID=46969 RepID=A0A7J6XDB7_THATH|nr:hypothetical protein FRX31_002875 [Thalictrum thalictroides]
MHRYNILLLESDICGYLIESERFYRFKLKYPVHCQYMDTVLEESGNTGLSIFQTSITCKLQHHRWVIGFIGYKMIVCDCIYTHPRTLASVYTYSIEWCTNSVGWTTNSVQGLDETHLKKLYQSAHLVT